MKNLVEFLDINYFTAPITLLEFQSKIGLLRENNNIEFYPEFEEELSQFSTQVSNKTHYRILLQTNENKSSIEYHNRKFFF